MKKMLIALLISGLGLGSAFAGTFAVNTPKNDKGQEAHPLYGGYSYKRITSATETMVCTGNCLLGEVFMGTGAAAGKVTFRDTNTADGAGTTVLEFLFLTDTAAAQDPKIYRPLRFLTGISAKISAISSHGEAIVVGYIDLDQP